MLGYLTHDIARFASENPTIDEMIMKIYGYSMSSPVGFLSVAFSVVALVLAVYAGTHMVSAREEETAGGPTPCVVAGTSRARWLGSRIGVALGAMLALALVAAVGAWAGANVSGASVGLLDVGRGLVQRDPDGAAVRRALGAGVRRGASGDGLCRVRGGRPSRSSIQIVGGLSSAPSWLTKLSPFSHIAPVPAASVDVPRRS